MSERELPNSTSQNPVTSHDGRDSPGVERTEDTREQWNERSEQSLVVEIDSQEEDGETSDAAHAESGQPTMISQQHATFSQKISTSSTQPTTGVQKRIIPSKTHTTSFQLDQFMKEENGPWSVYSQSRAVVDKKE
ncbi:hypothetical protein M501DRAFT_1059516 [Patellaria atrata CBS 101060]|uniref:Uncharacterized protein n=1 Tax=Patellaria atrata CBS 101060 TaxID=1346257 RepID=A0A9P4VR03_9PEZI|nr:hypothetical protein M501DRAFT_1059516 [Patellaria atrata CBS 101060]